MVDAPAVPVTAPATPATAPAAPAVAAEPKNMTPAQKLAYILQTPAVVAALSAGNENGQQVAADVRDTLNEYLKGKEHLFVAYVDAVQKTMEARLKAGLPAEKGDNEEAAMAKLSNAQRKAIEAAEKAEKAALTEVGKAMARNAPPSADPNDPMAAEKAVIARIAHTYSAPKAQEAHNATLAGIKDKLIKQSGGWIVSTTSDRIKAVAAAGSDPAKLEAAKAKLKEAIAKDKLTRDLSEADQAALLEALTTNASAAVEENKKANPVESTVADMATTAKNAAVAEVRGLPATLVRGALASSGAGPVASPLITGLAGRILPGGNTPP